MQSADIIKHGKCGGIPGFNNTKCLMSKCLSQIDPGIPMTNI